MSKESLPEFTPQAAKLWHTLTEESKLILLTHVICSKCRHVVTIKNYSGTVVAGDLLLSGQCAECNGDVARLVESA
jgi:uncharacterized CHY-type Zn-finger protein